ncbi:hypothetical protein ACET3X_007900 [Alternaria dauci]|uniref:Piwi-domain-containing protein n=1 Tax=Alternaria dauci TaxID=48095 RepID=A0ABR3UFR5_9PLEO
MKAATKDLDLYRYSIDFWPDEETELNEKKPRRKRVIELLLEMAPFSTLKIASDWAQRLVSTEKIPLEEYGQAYTVLWYQKGDEPVPPPTANEDRRVTEARIRNTYHIKVQALSSVSVADLLRDVSDRAFTYPLKLEAIEALNTIMTHGPSTALSVTAARSRFFPFGNHPQAESLDLGHGLQALRGYFTSVRTSVSRLLVNVNVATGAFYKPGPLLDRMREVCGGVLPANESDYNMVTKFFSPIRVETNYLPNNSGKDKENKGTKRKEQTIIFAKWGQHARNVSFPKLEANGTTTHPTVLQYFLKQYKIKLNFPEAPLANAGKPEDPVWIPAELCRILPGQLSRSLLPPQQTANIITFAARRPHANAESITGNGLILTKVNPVVNGENTNLKAFGVKVDPKMLTVPGRILMPPTVMYRGMKSRNPINGAWNLKIAELGTSPFRETRKLGAWNMLIINSGRGDAVPGGELVLKDVVRMFREELNKYGLELGPIAIPCIVRIAPGVLDNAKKRPELVETIRETIEKGLLGQLSAKPNFLLVLLPNQNVILYDVLKSLFDLKYGIRSVCCVGTKFANKSEQYFANVAMKFNQKLGGVNHIVDIKRMAPLDAQTIIFGIDVTHPSPGSSETAPSIAGVVASVDAMFSQYPASLRSQQGRKEMVTDLEEMIIERLRLWQKRNQNRLPNKVIVYRDGVGDGQYQQVVRVEGASFSNAFDKLYGAKAKHPKISIVMVGKRHHTRFYPTKLEDTDGSTGNPKPGTVVDRGVTGEKLFDFFLLAHQGLQGTDENRFGADQLQNLTHNLCYTFARATRSVSMCPPVYYADIVCERGRSYLHTVLKGGDAALSANAWSRDVHPALMETMYYL